MASNATRAAAHRRALAAGLTLSAAAHVVALAVLSLPGGAAGDPGAVSSRAIDDSFEAIRVVRFAEPAPTAKAEVAQVVSTSTSQAAFSRALSASVSAAPSLEALLGELEPAAVTVSIPESSTPVVTFRDLAPIAPSALLAYGAGAFEEEETGGGGIGGLLGRIGAALSGAGHCPTSDGPLILR